MADNYYQMTVNTFLPQHWFSPRDLAVLKAQGLSYEEDNSTPDDPRFYFFAEEGLCSPEDAAFALTCDTPDDEPLNAADIEEWDKLFQRKLNAPNANLPGVPPVTYIEAMGACTCSKLRPGEFGGFAVLITPDKIYSDDTYSWMRRAMNNAGIVSDG